jgi:pseudouridylate synthase
MTKDRMVQEWIRWLPEVREAVEAGRPVVALESTVIAHGLPRPRNLEVGRRLEEEIRGGGALAATIAVMDGVPTVGLAPEQLERIASADGVAKLSTRDLPVAMSRRQTGATTVAATAHLARRAGIEVFATGGIGGVHRGEPLDVSADLTELQRTRIIVVCSGAKSILDLPATREALETLGVLVLGWRTDAFPAFYTTGGDLPVDARVDDADEVAEIWGVHRESGAPGAVLLCVPVPIDQALPASELDDVTERALQAAADAGVTGKALTPFLLAEIARATDGASLDANVALLRNNASVAAMVAEGIARG